MAFAHDDSVLDFNRDAGYVSHLKAKIAAQERHMDWLQDRLIKAQRERRAHLSITFAAVTVALLMAANGVGA